MINHPNRSKSRPTANDVRKHYKDQGCEVRIDREGHVEYRPDPDYHPGADGAWLEGRWVSEYRFSNGQVVLV